MQAVAKSLLYNSASRELHSLHLFAQTISICRRKPRGETAMEEFSRKCHDSFRCRRFPNSTEFPPCIVRLNPSERCATWGIRFPISSSVISGWTNQSLSFPVSLSPFPAHRSLTATQATLRKCIIELASGCAFLWRLDARTRRAIVVLRGERGARERKMARSGKFAERDHYFNGVILHSFAILFGFSSRFLFLSYFPSRITYTPNKLFTLLI